MRARPWGRTLLAWDARSLRRIRGWSRPWAEEPMRVATVLGNGSTWWVYVALVWAWRGPLSAAALGFSAGTAALVAQAFKRSVRRRRPDVALADFHAGADNPDRFSFPSGHTCGAVGGAVGVWRVDPLLGGLFAALTLPIAFSRMYLGAHYPLDVLSGAALGAVSGWAASALLVWLWV